jgi:hypothetical protein
MTAQTKASLFERFTSVLLGAAATMVLGVALDIVVLPHKLKAQGESHEHRITELERTLADVRRDVEKAARDAAYVRGWVSRQPGAGLPPLDETE